MNAKESLFKHNKVREDDVSENLKHEKEMAMKVLSSILGGDFRAKFGHGESQEKVPEFRYKHVSIFVRAPSAGDPNWRGCDKIVHVKLTNRITNFVKFSNLFVEFLALSLPQCTQNMSE